MAKSLGDLETNVVSTCYCNFDRQISFGSAHHMVQTWHFDNYAPCFDDTGNTPDDWSNVKLQSHVEEGNMANVASRRYRNH